MVWTITLEITDCETTTKLPGAAVLDGNNNTTTITDANGQVEYEKDDSLNSFIVQITLNGYITASQSLSKTQNGTTVTKCLLPVPAGLDPNNPDAPTGHGGDDGGCFIVSATTGSSESAEVIRLRQLRECVVTVSRLGGELIDLIYRDYRQFSPGIAAELEKNTIAKEAALLVIVRPLLAWYKLAGVLAFEQADSKAIKQATQDVLSACPQYLGGTSILTLLETIRTGETLPPDTHPLLLDFAPRIQEASRLQFVSWAILDALVRVWRSATENFDVVDEVAQWLATAPIEVLIPPSDSQMLDVELGSLAGFFDFRPQARLQLGKRLMAAWPYAVGELKHTKFIL